MNEIPTNVLKQRLFAATVLFTRAGTNFARKSVYQTQDFFSYTKQKLQVDEHINPQLSISYFQIYLLSKKSSKILQLKKSLSKHSHPHITIDRIF